MTNLLLDDLPTSVKIDGKNYAVDTDFRTFIIFEKILMNDKLNSKQQVREIIDLFFYDETPTNIASAVRQVYGLYLCGKKPPKEEERRVKKNGEVEIKPPAIFDYEIDAPYIYSAFMSQYQIDLNDIEYLHWWKFKALFSGLNSGQKIVEIMGYRATNTSKIKSKSERNRIEALKMLYALPNNISDEEKVARAGAAFGGGF